MHVNGKFQTYAALCLEKGLPQNLTTDWVDHKVSLDSVEKRQIFFTA